MLRGSVLIRTQSTRSSFSADTRSAPSRLCGAGGVLCSTMPVRQAAPSASTDAARPPAVYQLCGLQMDNIERLECVYYSGPVPRDVAALTALCFVFDKIHFPGVYLPKGDYDRELLQREIARLEALSPREHRAASQRCRNVQAQGCDVSYFTAAPPSKGRNRRASR